LAETRAKKSASDLTFQVISETNIVAARLG
jgi:hypothetical protein